jgi:LPXTG-site transpeptidase (sortase) family protein
LPNRNILKKSLQSILLILLGLAIISGGVYGFVSSSIVPANPPDPQFDTLVEYSAEDIQAGFAPMVQPAIHSGAPTLQATLTEGTAELLPGQAEPNTPQPTSNAPLLIPDGLIPDRIVIEKIGLDAPVKLAGMRVVKGYELDYVQWLAPDEFAAGWHADSATLGKVGNTVLNGHHNVFGEVFGGLKDLESGDLILLYSGSWQFTYAVANTMILPERDEKLKVRLDNASCIDRSDDERLTLITCWPPESNTHRVIIVAVRVSVKINR